jgi:predicted short-subunit dehydrogenase-like oxidoreductase (DUF2520 family)
MKLVLLGSGNVATVLGSLAVQNGHTVVQVYGRNANTTEMLALKVSATAVNNLTSITPFADLYIIAVNDYAIENIAAQLQLHNRPVVHTAGAVSMALLQKVSTSYGVLWPAQSLRKESLHVPVIPFVADANNPAMMALLKNFAASMQSPISFGNDAERAHLHAMAVVVSNFTNHLYHLAADYCTQVGVDFKLLQPLIAETANRLEQYHPSEIQTGPAIRGDDATIARHLELLNQHLPLQMLYRRLTQSIRHLNPS